MVGTVRYIRNEHILGAFGTLYADISTRLVMIALVVIVVVVVVVVLVLRAQLIRYNNLFKTTPQSIWQVKTP